MLKKLLPTLVYSLAIASLVAQPFPGNPFLTPSKTLVTVTPNIQGVIPGANITITTNGDQTITIAGTQAATNGIATSAGYGTNTTFKGAITVEKIYATNYFGNGNGLTNINPANLVKTNLVLLIEGDSWSDTNNWGSAAVTGAANWTAIMVSYLTNCNIVVYSNRATAQSSSFDISNRFNTAISPATNNLSTTNIGVIILEAGINDSRDFAITINPHPTPLMTLLSVSNFCYRAHTAYGGGFKVIITTVPETWGSSLEQQSRFWVREYYSMLLTNTFYDGLIDLWTIFNDPGNSNIVNSADNLHPTRSGHMLLGQLAALKVSDFLSGYSQRNLALPSENPGPVSQYFRDVTLAETIRTYVSNNFNNSLWRWQASQGASGDSTKYQLVWSDIANGYTNAAGLIVTSFGNVAALNKLSWGSIGSGDGSGITNVVANVPTTNTLIIPPAGNGTSDGLSPGYEVMMGDRFVLTTTNIVRYVNYQVVAQGSGNILVGIYKLSGTLSGSPTATKVVSTGFIATPAVGAARTDLTATTLSPGQYIVGIYVTNTSTIIAKEQKTVNQYNHLVIKAGGIEGNFTAGTDPTSFVVNWGVHAPILTIEGNY